MRAQARQKSAQVLRHRTWRAALQNLDSWNLIAHRQPRFAAIAHSASRICVIPSYLSSDSVDRELHLRQIYVTNMHPAKSSPIVFPVHPVSAYSVEHAQGGQPGKDSHYDKAYVDQARDTALSPDQQHAVLHV